MSLIDTYELLFQLTMATILLPIVQLFRKLKHQPPEYQWLLALLAFSFFCDFANSIQLKTLHLNANYFGTFFTLFNPILLCFFFYKVLQWKWLKTPMIVLIVAHLLFAILNLVFIQKGTINSYSAILEKLVIMLLSILYYYKAIKEPPSENIYDTGLFWVISSLFIFNSVKLIINAFAHYLILFQDNLVIAWLIHNIMSVCSHLIIGYGVWLHNKNLKSPTLA